MPEKIDILNQTGEFEVWLCRWEDDVDSEVTSVKSQSETIIDNLEQKQKPSSNPADAFTDKHEV